MGENTDTVSHYTENERPCKHSAINGISPSIPPLKAQGTLQKRKPIECKSQILWSTPSKQGPLNQYDWCAYELTETKAACTGPAWVCTRLCPRTKRRNGYIPPPPELSPIDNNLQMKIEFSPMESHLGNKLPLSPGPMSSRRQPTQNEFIGNTGGFLCHSHPYIV